MSTPPGRPIDPFELSAYAPKRVRERHAAGQAASENDEQSAASHPLQPALQQNAADEHPVDLDRVEPANPAAERSGEPAVPHRRRKEAAGDDELHRLESSLLWVQREAAATRLPRAVQLPPVAGLRPVKRQAPARPETFINGFRVPPSLAPERLQEPRPIRRRGGKLRMPLRVLMAGVVAAPIAYYFAAAGLFPDSKSARGPLLASIGPGAVAPAPRPDTARDDDGPGISSRAETPAPRMALSPPMPATSFPVPAAPGPASAAPESSPGETPAVQPARELDPEDIQLLIKQGEQFVAAGDLVTARVVFRRAAEADNATAALALGATYDPIVLAKLGTRGIVADVEQARSWYEKAKAFGSPDAPRRLELLANR